LPPSGVPPLARCEPAVVHSDVTCVALYGYTASAQFGNESSSSYRALVLPLFLSTPGRQRSDSCPVLALPSRTHPFFPRDPWLSVLSGFSKFLSELRCFHFGLVPLGRPPERGSMSCCFFFLPIRNKGMRPDITRSLLELRYSNDFSHVPRIAGPLPLRPPCSIPFLQSGV